MTVKTTIFSLIEEQEPDDANAGNKENVTERLAAVRQTKFNQLWNELINKISQINQVKSSLVNR